MARPRGAADALTRSAAQGRSLAALLDPDTPVPGATQSVLHPELAAIAVPTTIHGRNMAGDDFALKAGWGHYGTGDAVMPGQGRVVQRPYTPEERIALGDALPVPGETTFDIYLNGRAYWRNIPTAVWTYRLGGLPSPQEMALLPGSTPSSTVRSRPRKSSTSPTPLGGSARYWWLSGPVVPDRNAIDA